MAPHLLALVGFPARVVELLRLRRAPLQEPDRGEDVQRELEVLRLPVLEHRLAELGETRNRPKEIGSLPWRSWSLLKSCHPATVWKASARKNGRKKIDSPFLRSARRISAPTNPIPMKSTRPSDEREVEHEHCARQDSSSLRPAAGPPSGVLSRNAYSPPGSDTLASDPTRRCVTRAVAGQVHFTERFGAGRRLVLLQLLARRPRQLTTGRRAVAGRNRLQEAPHCAGGVVLLAAAARQRHRGEQHGDRWRAHGGQIPRAPPPPPRPLDSRGHRSDGHQLLLQR